MLFVVSSYTVKKTLIVCDHFLRFILCYIDFKCFNANFQEKYAMRYRAGVAPSRQSGKRKSEYAYKFDWKKPINSTPLLAADQVWYESCVSALIHFTKRVKTCLTGMSRVSQVIESL